VPRKRRFDIGKWAKTHPRKMAAARRKAHRDPPVHTRRWERMVRAIKVHGGAENPYAVATARLGRGSFVHHSKSVVEWIWDAIEKIAHRVVDHERRIRALEARL
jgi:hypothetical protein